jgi:hypothetical protein
MRTLLASGAAVLATFGFGITAATASAETVVTFPGSPLTVDVGGLGQCQSSYLVHGEVAGNFFLGANPLGDCGFFLAFPTARTGQPAGLKGRTYGFTGLAGPGIPGDPEEGFEYTPVGQSAVTGAGTEASPYTQTTTFEVVSGVVHYLLVTETTTYINGQPQFTSTYVVKNLTSETIFFRAMYAGDLYVNGNDLGTGVFLAGPPRFIGGQNTGSGILGGFVEVPPPALPWSSFQEAYWNETFEGQTVSEGDNGIWHDVRSTANQPRAFNEHIEPLELDNAAGVEWDQFYNEGTGLAAHGEQAFTIINRTQIPSGLQISPAAQSVTQGQAAAINVTSLDNAGQPYAGRTLRYTISGANPQTGAITLNSQGQAQIAYIAHNAGIDTVQMYVDLGGSSVQTPNDPAGAATVTVVPAPPTPNSSYTIQSVKANANGTITIVFVPTQNGTGTVEVTVPTGTIAKKHKGKCKKGQVKIKGKCLPPNTNIGKASANGTAGVPLTITVQLSGKARAKLKKGKTLHVLATLTYRSALGGTPTVNTYHLAVPGQKPKHHRHHK